MAQKHHSVKTLLRYGLLGMLSGAIVGALAGALFVAASPARFEANVRLFHKPGSKMSDSARDFLAAAVARQDLLPDFAREQQLSAKMETLLTRNLTVVAKDASWPVAEMRLVGSDAAAIGTTLDALATYMAEKLQSTEATALQSHYQELEERIATATRRYYDLVLERIEYGTLPKSALGRIRATTNVTEQRLELELSERYGLRRQSADLKFPRRENDIVTPPEQLKPIVGESASVDSDHVKFERTFALARAELRVLERTNRRLVGMLDRSKTLRVLRSAEVIPLPTEHPPILILVAACGVIGGLGGGFAWSLSQSGGLSGPMLERRLRIPVVGMMAKSLTDYGERELCPMAQADPQPLAIASVRSLSVALHLLSQKHGRAGPVIFAEIGDTHLARHVAANLAVVAAQAGSRVLIVEAGSGENLLSNMFANNDDITRSIAVDVNEFAGETDAHRRFGDGNIYFNLGDGTANNSNSTTLPVPSEMISQFDRVFIHVGNAPKARYLVNHYKAAIGLVACTADTRFSVLRKTIGNTLHGVVLCGYSIQESDYLRNTANG